MRPQTIKYGDGYEVIKIEDSNTFLVHSSKLALGSLYTPTIFVEGISNEKIKFDFYKAYKNVNDVVLHCEYRAQGELPYKLIVHTQ